MALQHRLRKSGPLPSRNIVAAALAMATKSVAVAVACDAEGIPRGSRSRAADLRDRILSEGLIAACAPPPPPPELPPPIDWPQKYADEITERYPQLQPPCCPTCGTNCNLVTFLCQSNWKCDECQIGPFPASVYWISQCTSDECQQKYNGSYALCHVCTPETAQVDWNSVGTSIYIGTPPWKELHPPEERAEYFETLSVYNNVDAEYGYNIGDAVPEGYSVASEVSTAKALLLPCHQPDPQRMDALFDPDNYFSRLLVSKEWIASNAPNIWELIVCPLCISEDGKHATRHLTATMKVAENERDLDDDDEWTNECLFDIVEYDFPVLDSNDIFARQRHIEKMRQREVASIRLLDGDAAINHSERKKQMACDRQYQRGI